jgi:hypothetical protein
MRRSVACYCSSAGLVRHPDERDARGLPDRNDTFAGESLLVDHYFGGLNILSPVPGALLPRQEAFQTPAKCLLCSSLLGA